MTLVKRLVKGSAITAAEHDGNMDHVLDMDNMVEGATTKVLTADERTKLAGVATSANNYVHPNHTGDVTSTGDGATAIAAGVIVDADVNASAGIALSKLQAVRSLASTATAPAADDYLLLDGAANGTRKILARLVGERLYSTAFGLPPGDYSADPQPVRDFMLAAAAQNKIAHFTAGEYIWGGDFIVNVPAGQRLHIAGDGRSRTMLKRVARNLDGGNNLRFLRLVAGSSDCELIIEDLTIHGNAQENPLLLPVTDSAGFEVGEIVIGSTSGASATVLYVEAEQLGLDFRSSASTPFELGETVVGQTSSASTTTTAALNSFAREQCDAIGTFGNWRLIELSRVISTSPVADTLNLRGGDHYRVVMRDFDEVNRTRNRNALTQNRQHRFLDIINCRGGDYSLESASTFEPSNAIITTIKDSHLSVYLGISASGAPENVRTFIQNCILTRILTAGRASTQIAHSTIYPTTWRLTGVGGRLEVKDSTIVPTESSVGGVHQENGRTLIFGNTSIPARIHFERCKFRRFPDDVVGNFDGYVGIGAGTSDDARIFSITDCECEESRIDFARLRLPGTAMRVNIAGNRLSLDSGKSAARVTRDFMSPSAEDQKLVTVADNTIIGDGYSAYLPGTMSNQTAYPTRFRVRGNRREVPTSTPLLFFDTFSHVMPPYNDGTLVQVLDLGDAYQRVISAASGDGNATLIQGGEFAKRYAFKIVESEAFNGDASKTFRLGTSAGDDSYLAAVTADGSAEAIVYVDGTGQDIVLSWTNNAEASAGALTVTIRVISP